VREDAIETQTAKFDVQEFAEMNGIPAGAAIPDAIRSAYSLRGRPRETATYMEFLVLLDHAPSVNKQDLVDKMLRFCAPQSPADKASPTPEQAAAPLIQLLERLAARHGGRTPLTEFLQVPGMQLGEGRGANRFRSLDADRDGFVTKLELETLVKSEIANQVEKMSALDADGDGALSKAEYALSLPTHQNRGESANRTPAAKGDFAGSRFDGYDLNRDGKISREEISRFVIANALSRNWANATIPRLTVVDTNKDSYIDKSEFAVFGVGVLLVMADNTGGPGGTPRIKTEHPEKVPIERMTRNLLHLDNGRASRSGSQAG
jgi:Ca2+-binding EF-hand superfamily protein